MASTADPITSKPVSDGFQPVDLSEKTRKKWAAPAEEYVPPPVQDLTIDNITPNVIAVNSNVHDNPRLQYIITKLIQASHDFVRDVDLKFEEWTAAWEFLTRVSRPKTFKYPFKWTATDSIRVGRPNL